ncbi:MAG: polysaccharide biosynthesis tyrosine autokinase [Oscillospiraceae bacterium]
MEENNELDLGYLWNVFRKHAIVIILVSLICAAGAYIFTEYCIEKKYESIAMLYVENNSQSGDSVNINDINAAQKLVNTCQILFKSNTVLARLIDELDLVYDKEELDEMITAQSVNGTEVLKLAVESKDPMEAQKIVNQLVEIAEDEFSRVIKSGSIEVVDYGEANFKPSFPNTLLITAAGFIAGFVIMYIIMFVADMLNVTVKRDDNIAETYKIPVFAEIMDFKSSGSSAYGYSNYGYGDNKNTDKTVKSENEIVFSDKFINQDTPFAIIEAYNTARTNIMFAASTSKRKVVAVTSCNPSEGKSTTCANIAISFANAGHKVLLVECDMRKPTMKNNFGLENTVGLSSVLGGFNSVNEAVNVAVINNLDVIAAGDIPPNPSELLTSESMKVFIDASLENYDYVFLDTPPVNVVTDSQLMNDYIAGIVFVVRENSTTYPDIQTAFDRIAIAKGRVLGFVKTFCQLGKSKKYGKKYAYNYKYGYSNKNVK